MSPLECPFLLLVLGPVLCQRLASWRALEDAAPALDERRSHGFEKDSLRCGLDHGLCPVLDVELFAQAKWDDDLPLRREPYSVELLSHTHVYKYDIAYKVRQCARRRIIIAQEESRGSSPDPLPASRGHSPHCAHFQRRRSPAGTRLGRNRNPHIIAQQEQKPNQPLHGEISEPPPLQGGDFGLVHA